jgi:hypothetical protein
MEGPRSKRIALVGLGPSSLQYISYCDSKGGRREAFDETWVINSYCSILQCDRIFHMDDLRVQELRARAGNPKVAGMLKALRENTGIPVVTSYMHEDYPHLEEFPLEEALVRFGSLYYNSTVPYAVVYAMLQGPAKIESLTMFGMDYTMPDIHISEEGRACLEFWCGRATQMGIKVSAVDTSSLFDSMKHRHGRVSLYGYDDFDLEVKVTGPTTIDLRKVQKALPDAAAVERKYGLEVKTLPSGEKVVERKVGGGTAVTPPSVFPESMNGEASNASRDETI